MTDITGTPAWQNLREHYGAISGTHLRDMFDADPTRGTDLTTTAGDLYIDYSKNRVDRETIRLLTTCLLYTSPSPRD